MRTVTPCRKGSVFEVFRLRCAESFLIVTSLNNRLVVGSNWVFLEVVYSDMRRKPKNAVVIAAHSINLSSKSLEELNRLC